MKYTEGNVSYFFSPQQRSYGIVALLDDYQNIRREGYFAAGNPLHAALYIRPSETKGLINVLCCSSTYNIISLMLKENCL